MKTQYNITEINPKTIKQVRQMINDSLSIIMEENNLRFELGNASYDNDSFKFTGFRISLADALTPEQKALQQMLTMRRKASWEKTLDGNKIGYDRGVGYLLVGYKTRARIKPWLIESVEDGVQYVAPDSMVERMFGEEE
jgi:hypothetical protein